MIKFLKNKFFAVLGFIPPDFIGIEREEDFTLQAGYLSGKPAPGGILDLQLKLGTAGMYRHEPRQFSLTACSNFLLTIAWKF